MSACRYNVGEFWLTKDKESLIQIVKVKDDQYTHYCVEGRVVAGREIVCTWTKDGVYNDSSAMNKHDLDEPWARPISEFRTQPRVTDQAIEFHIPNFVWPTMMDDRIRGFAPINTGDMTRAIQRAARDFRMPIFHVEGSFDMAAPPKQPEQPAPKEVPKPPVCWDDVIGQAEAKQALREALEASFLEAEVYQAFKLPTPKGVLLYGPPGCGKTMLGKACAGSMATLHKKAYKDGFFYFNGAEMLGPAWDSEVEWVRKAFKQAEDFHKANGYPAVLFFDECDAMLPHRSSANFFHKNAVNLFLTKMDGMEARTAFVILATNDITALDEAAIRPGRIDKRILVGHPSKADCRDMLRAYITKAKLPAGADIDTMTQAGHGLLFHEKFFIEGLDWTEKLSGAQIEAVVAEAARVAFRRACAESRAGAKDPAAWGITPPDLEAGVRLLYEEKKNMKSEQKKHKPLMERFMEQQDRIADDLRKQGDDPLFPQDPTI